MLDGKLETFLVVAQCGSYTKAAEQLHFTQPAITQQIRRLEEAYGCALVEFHGRSFVLTAEGEALLEYAKIQKANERRLREKLTHMVHPLRVGATLSIADYYLPHRLKRAMAQPGFCLQVEVGNTKTLLDRMLEGQLDCGLIEGMFDESLFEAIPFCQAAFLPVVRGGHPLAGVGDHGGTSLFFALCGRFSFKDTKPYETPERRLKWRIAADQREALPKGEVFVLT